MCSDDVYDDDDEDNDKEDKGELLPSGLVPYIPALSSEPSNKEDEAR